MTKITKKVLGLLIGVYSLAMLTGAGPVIWYTATKAKLIPSAGLVLSTGETVDNSSIVTTAAQSFSGVKTFSDGVKYGGGGTTLNYHVEGTSSFAVNVGVSGSVTIGYSYLRLGSIVAIIFTSCPSITVSGTPSQLTTGNGAAPFNPARAIQGFLYVTGSSVAASVPAAFQIDTSGKFYFYKNGNNDAFTNATAYNITPGQTLFYSLQ